MSYEIILQMEDVSGVLARAMSCLRKLGLTTLGHSFEEFPGGGRKLILEVDGPVLADDQLRPHLEALRGVVELLTEGLPEAATPTQTTPTVEPGIANTRYKNADSEAGDADMRDRMLIFSLLSRYPKLSARLVEINGAIPEPERIHRMQELGQGFGRHLSKNLKAKGSITELRSAIELLIVPGLSPLAQISQNRDGLRISGFTKHLKHMADKPECCAFLNGTIQGLLDSAEELPPHQVEQTQCIHDGAVTCEYRIVPA